MIDICNQKLIARGYWDEFGAREYVLFCFKHLDRLNEEGRFPELEELGSRSGLRLVDITEGVEVEVEGGNVVADSREV